MVLPTTAMLDLIRDTLDAIKPIPLLRFETAQAHLDSLTKPLGSLGLLEDLAKKYGYPRYRSSISQQEIGRCIRGRSWGHRRGH